MSAERARAALESAQRVHFIGIGGIGMSAVAQILASRGKQVTGTDRQDSERLLQLRRQGIDARSGHDARLVEQTDCVVVTTALPEDNVELQHARELHLPIIHRAEALAAIISEYKSIAVTGTHGKSTTTAMVGWILQQAGLDPLVIVGADVVDWGGNVRLGGGRWAVFEACESDGTILLYRNCSQVIMSLEPDHLDQHGTFKHLLGTMQRFAQTADSDGFVAYNTDCDETRQVAESSSTRRVGFGKSNQAEYRLTRVQSRGAEGIEFLVELPSGSLKGRLRLFGKHNAFNALAAVAAAEQVGVSASDGLAALEQFSGLRRRFEIIGQWRGCPVVDDYAHHPTEVRATIAAARAHFPRRLVAIFQPHLYSRTRDLMAQFACAFNEADEVIITSIYPAREEPIPGVTGEALAEAVRQQRGSRPTYFLEKTQIAQFVHENYGDDWLILVMGAGDITNVAREIAGGK